MVYLLQKIRWTLQYHLDYNGSIRCNTLLTIIGRPPVISTEL